MMKYLLKLGLDKTGVEMIAFLIPIKYPTSENYE
jgi:hypothetical protein